MRHGFDRSLGETMDGKHRESTAPGRRVMRVVMGVTVCATLAACGTAARSTSPALVSPASPAACSATAPAAIPAERWSQARRELAPTGASAIRLCRYSGLNAHPRLALLSSRLLDGSALVRELVGELDRLPSPPRVAFCPNDDGSRIVALLAYPGGRAVTISVGLTGCEPVTNGSVQRTAAAFGGFPPSVGPRLVAQLERLLRARTSSPSLAGSAAALAHGRWSVLARSPLGTRYEPTFVWDGRELLELGGTASERLGAPPLDSGATFDPPTGRWRRVASMPAAIQSAGAASAWTGSELFASGGPALPGETASDLAGLYDPVTHFRTAKPPSPQRSSPTTSSPWIGYIRSTVVGASQPDAVYGTTSTDAGAASDSNSSVSPADM